LPLPYSSQTCIITLVAASGFSLSPDIVKNAAQQINATHHDWLAKNEAVDIFCPPRPVQDLYAILATVIGDLPIDKIAQPATTRRKKLLLADMESTIIEQEMLDELANMLGMGSKIADITRRAMNGELDFAASLHERASLLKSQPVKILENAAKRITFMPGAKTLIATMRANGTSCWLVSGGFTYFAQPVAQQLGFDRCFANDLLISEGKISGVVAQPILDKDSKKTLLEKAQSELNLTPADAMTVGDGANDIPMLAACNEKFGLGIAYHAKPRVRATIPHQINHSNLTALLYAQGYKKEDFKNAEGNRYAS